MNIKKKAIYCSAILLVSFSAFVLIVPEFMPDVFLLEILGQYRLQTSFLALLCAIVLLWWRFFSLFVVQVALLVFSLFLIFSGYNSGRAEGCVAGFSFSQNIRVMSFNVYRENENYADILDAIERANPDVLLLQEVRAGLYHFAHTKLYGNYPFYYSEFEDGIQQGKAIYSRYPIEGTKRRPLHGNWQHVLHAKVNFKEEVVNVINVHTVSPKNSLRVAARNTDVMALGALVGALDDENEHVIVAGDFNSVPWQSSMRGFKKETSLNNGALYNIIPTWPTWLPVFFSVPIDHIFYSGKLVNPLYYRGLSAGSDHNSVYVDLSMCK